MVDCSRSPCSVSNYAWTSLASPSRTTATIPSSDPRWCTGCVLIIGALVQNSAASQSIGPVDFLIVAASSGPGPAWPALSPGVPHLSTLGPGALDYYRVLVPWAQANVSVSLTPFVGTVELYVALNTSLAPPDPTHFTLSQLSAWGGSIEIKVPQPKSARA